MPWLFFSIEKRYERKNFTSLLLTIDFRWKMIGNAKCKHKPFITMLSKNRYDESKSTVDGEWSNISLSLSPSFSSINVHSLFSLPCLCRLHLSPFSLFSSCSISKVGKFRVFIINILFPWKKTSNMLRFYLNDNEYFFLSLPLSLFLFQDTPANLEVFDWSHRQAAT